MRNFAHQNYQQLSCLNAFRIVTYLSVETENKTSSRTSRPFFSPPLPRVSYHQAFQEKRGNGFEFLRISLRFF